MVGQERWLRWFESLSIDDVSLVGGKNASLGEMYQELTPKGILIPNGFAVTAEAYRYTLDKAGAWEALHEVLYDLNGNDVSDLARRGKKAREIVYSASMPDDLREEIRTAYGRLKAEYGDDVTLAVRSSATAEDLPTASFAGQQDTYLNISGEAMLLDAVQRCFASLYTDRAIHYRLDQGFDQFKVGLSVGVMKMVRSDLSASGVMFSIDTETGFSDVVFITGAYGLGENVVQGAVEPDEFYVHKPTLKQGFKPLIRRHLGSKQIKMIYADGHTRATTKNEKVPREDRVRFCISDDEVLQLARYAVLIEEHYSQRAGQNRPMDMEWAKDALDGRLYIVQARPETVASQQTRATLEQYHLDETGELLVTGYAVGTRIGQGRVRYIADVTHLNEFQPGEVLVADTTTPDWEPVMKVAAGIVTNRGGRTCHAAIVSRELGIPAVVGCDNATEQLNTGDDVTVSCAEGDEGRVYRGLAKYHVERTNLDNLERPKTKIMLNLGNPDLAFSLAALPNDGVGLARLEFIINESIKAHPMALLYPERVESAAERKALKSLVGSYEDGRQFFVQRLSEGVATIAAAFYPRPVVVRLSDFKSNEYASLLGGKDFEPVESNPMIGFRGAARYTHDSYHEAFAMECEAMKRVREEMGLTNVKLMIPFCRRVEEGQKVLEEMAQNGLKRGENSLEIYVMCEIPNNVIQIDRFSSLFDGFSIGSNDLTQLTLGVDRDSEMVSFDFDERDEGVKAMIRMAVEGARRNGRHSGLCGQAPSDYPEMAKYLVELGIDSMSLNPDTVIKTTQLVLEVEKELSEQGAAT
ncbi:MAG: phosphoenolpyruvate synthase [Thiotrichales bacterium]